MANLKIAPSIVNVLKIIWLDEAVTPEKINAHMGNDYASKHICNLRKLGYDFETVKAGRKIVSYKLVQIPDNDEEIRNFVKPVKAKPAPKAAKAPKTEAKSEKTSAKIAHPKMKAKTVAEIKATNLAKLKEVAEKRKARLADMEETGTDNAREERIVQSSFSIDNDFDSFEGVNLSELV